MKNLVRYLVASICLSGVGVCIADVENHVQIHFEGELTGETYQLAAGERDATGSFKAVGEVGLRCGRADIRGGANGFVFDPSTIGTLVTSNWVAEAVVNFEKYGDGQATVISVQGDTDFRILFSGDAFEVTYWDGAEDNKMTSGLPPRATDVHVALVWTGAQNRLEAFVNGEPIGSVGGTAYDVSAPGVVSFGFFGREEHQGRGINGQLDAVAFSTFSDEFSPTTGFQLIRTMSPSATVRLNGSGLELSLRRTK